jgi:hypothetical protein
VHAHAVSTVMFLRSLRRFAFSSSRSFISIASKLLFEARKPSSTVARNARNSDLS